MPGAVDWLAAPRQAAAIMPASVNRTANTRSNKPQRDKPHW